MVVSEASRPREDPQIAELSHELIVDRLEHLGDQGALLGRQDFFLGRVGGVAARAEAMDVRRREPAGRDQVEQLFEAQVLASADAQDRHELALRDRVVGCLSQLVGGDRFAFEVAHHQLFVELDDLLDHHADRPRRAPAGMPAGSSSCDLSTSTTPENDVPCPTGTLNGTQSGAERLANRGQVASVVDVLGVHLGHHDEPAQAQSARFLKDAPGVDLDAGRARDGHDHVFDGRERRERTADEIGIARRVDQVNLLSVPREVPQVAVDGEMPAFFFFVDVERAGAVVDGALAAKSHRR